MTTHAYCILTSDDLILVGSLVGVTGVAKKFFRGSKSMGSSPSPPFPSFPFLSLPLLFLPITPFPIYSLPLPCVRSRNCKIQLGGLRSAASSPSWVWTLGQRPSRNRIWCIIWLKISDQLGTILIIFPSENQLIRFSAALTMQFETKMTAEMNNGSSGWLYAVPCDVLACCTGSTSALLLLGLPLLSPIRRW